MKHGTIISYALSFTSFILDSPISNKINKIILFGSAARGDFTKESDVDIFIDGDEKLEPELTKLHNLFKSSRAYKTWQLKGIKNELSLKVGDLSKWSLRREVISSGILLYGKYNELPKAAHYYALIKVEKITQKKSAQQIKIFRKLYGYSQKVGKKVYHWKGLVAEVQGKKLGRGVFIIPMEHRQEIISFLNKNHISYAIYELWSDAFQK